MYYFAKLQWGQPMPDPLSPICLNANQYFQERVGCSAGPDWVFEPIYYWQYGICDVIHLLSSITQRLKPSST